VAGDMTIHLPSPEPTGPLKDQMYRYRGETVSIGATMDWVIRRLAAEFAASSQPTTARRWEDIKRYLRELGITQTLQRELQAVAEYFKAREMAAHAATVIVQVGEASQIFRLYYDGPTQKVDSITTEDLKDESALARTGYAAAQAVGRALDDEQPQVLAGLNSIVKALLIGRT
jgi:hypothetical protein